MYVDAHYVIGSGHITCQDYALAEHHGRGAFAVVSDGCSSSPDTDIGSRLLARAAAAQLRHDAFALEDCLALSGRAVDAVGLESAALDATLVVARVDPETIDVRIFGDGVVAATTEDGVLESLVVAYENGAPDYPSYRACMSRHHEYLRDLSSPRVLSGDLTGYATERDHVQLLLPRAHYTAVAILSDGATAVADASGGLVEVGEVLQTMALGSGQCRRGAFAARRLRRWVRRDCPRLGWTPRDDIAAAVIRW